VISRSLEFAAIVARVKIRLFAGRLWIARVGAAATLLATLVLAGCGATLKAGPVVTVGPQTSSAPGGCAGTVLATLSSVLQRVYREGVHGERIGSAEYLIAHSEALRAAVESGNTAAALLAARALLKTGHLTDLSVTRGGQPFVDVGGAALAPLHGTLTGTNGAPIASYATSVWADEGFLIEATGIGQGLVALRDGPSWIAEPGTRGVAALRTATLGDEGTLTLGDEGTLTLEHVPYAFTSFPAEAYPSGAVRVYLLLPTSVIAPLCGHTSQDTIVNALKRVADLIYTGELGQSAQKQVRRVQHNKALLEAVARREPGATELAIKALLNQHIVRMRVSAGGQLLSDVGGPYVLAPVTAPLQLHGRTIGGVVLSIQDDEGYLRLTRRLAGLDVLMYMNVDGVASQLVKNSLGPAPGPALAAVPASGAYHYEGRSFRVFTVNAEAFPSGPLTIRVLVPLPYS
jgi:hypothetical protein